MKNRLLVSSSFLLLLSAPIAQAIPPVYTLQTGIGSDDVSGDNDTFFHVTANALFSRGLSRNSIVNLTAEVSSYHYQEVDDNSANKLFLQAEYSYTPRAGFRVPTYSVAVRQLEEYKKDSDLDASTTSLLLSVGFRIDDQSNIMGGLRFREKTSNNDTSETGFFVNFDYSPGNDWLFYTTLIVADEETEVGDSMSMGARIAGKSHLPGEPGYTGPASSGTSDSDNTWFTVGASYALDSHRSIDMAYNRQTYDTQGGDTENSLAGQQPDGLFRHCFGSNGLYNR